MDASVQSGANKINSIRFYLSDPSPYYQAALEVAVRDALAKAVTLARQINSSLYPVPLQIVESSYQTFSPSVPVLYQMAAETQIQTGQMEVAAQIQAVFAYW